MFTILNLAFIANFIILISAISNRTIRNTLIGGYALHKDILARGARHTFVIVAIASGALVR